MKYTFEFQTKEERQIIVEQNTDKTLIEEKNLTEGNFLMFSDDPENDTKQVVYVNVPEEEFEVLKQENIILRAQNNALSERADFIEDVVAEMAIQVYQ